MRLWTIHPQYLDGKGLTALWRESLLAQKVLQGRTKGYRFHPQLIRFRSHRNPEAAIGYYLFQIACEAQRRGYRFDQRKILKKKTRHPITATRGQLLYEWQHLKRKLRERNPEKYLEIRSIRQPQSHALFRIVAGKIETWEKRHP